MRIPNILLAGKIAYRSWRTYYAAAILALGLTLFVVSLSMMNGFERILRQDILGVFGHINVTWKDKQHVELLPQLEKYPYGLWHAKYGNHILWVYGFNKQDKRVQALIPKKTKSGFYLTSNLATRLGVDRKHNLSLTLYSNPPIRITLPVAGFINTEASLYQNFIFVDLEYINHPKIHTKLFVENIFQADSAAQTIVNNIQNLGDVTTWKKVHGALAQAINQSRQLIIALVGLILFIAWLNFTMVSMILVNRESSTISLLHQIGGEVRMIFWWRVMWVYLGAITLGTILGIILSLYLEDIYQFLDLKLLESAIYPVHYLPSSLVWSDIVYIVIGSLFLGVITAFYAAQRANKLTNA